MKEKDMNPEESGYYYRIFKSENYAIVMLAGKLPLEVPGEFVDEISRFILSPANILVNCLCMSRLPFHWQNLFQSLHFLLTNSYKNIGLIFLPESLRRENEAEGGKQVQQLKVYPHLKDFFLEIRQKDREVGFNFIKAFVFSTVRTLMIQAKTPSSRKRIYGTDDTPERKLLGSVNGLVVVTLEDFFYVVCLSFPDRAFLRVISAMLYEEVTVIDEKVKDGAAELINIILGQTKKIVNTKDKQIKTQTPVALLGDNLPEEPIHFNNQSYRPFREGVSVVIPFSSSAGEFSVEIWFPRVFKTQVMEKIK